MCHLKLRLLYTDKYFLEIIIGDGGATCLMEKESIISIQDNNNTVSSYEAKIPVEKRISG